jgi:hypothetical protein
MSNAMTHMVAALTSPPKPRAKPADVWQIPYMENGELRQFRPRGANQDTTAIARSGRAVHC